MNNQDGQIHDQQTLRIANEFAIVLVRKVYTRNGERLEIRAPKLGYVIHLDAIQLESLTWQESELFSKFLEHPYGPEKLK
jgi:hypothetical protein